MSRAKALAQFVLPLLLLVVITLLLWTSYGVASSYRLFGSAAFSAVFYVAAVASTVILFVFVTGTLLMRIGFEWLRQPEPTQLQRRLIIAMLTFIAAAVALWYSGFDPRAIITTSALVSAVVALSVQPMLGSLMSGLTVHRQIRIGDAVLLDGAPVEITSLNWRSVSGRKDDGTAVVVPNAKLADGMLHVLAHDQPVRADVRLDIPRSVAPHRLRKLVAELVYDFQEVDPTQPVVTLPFGDDSSRLHAGLASAWPAGSIGYRIQFWVRHYAQRADVEGRVLRRFWYAFQRENIVAAADGCPEARVDGDPARHLNAVMAALSKTARPAATLEEASRAALAAGETLLYDEGERIVLPLRLTSRACVLLEGALSEVTASERNGNAAWTTMGHARHELTRTVWLSLIERALIQRIGPYATWAVERAAAGGATRAEVCEVVAREIDDPIERDAFLREASPSTESVSGPGLLFGCARDTAHRLVANPPLRVVDYALILAVPESALRADPEAR
jgi:small-conductance mechanosensitive channel